MTYDCYCDYDQPEFCNISTVKARKEHKCEECRATIQPGDKYKRTVGKWEGDLLTFATCGLCDELQQWASISVPCFCWAYGELHEEVRDMVDQIKVDVPGIVFEWGRRMIKIERVRYGKHWPRRRPQRRKFSHENLGAAAP